MTTVIREALIAVLIVMAAAGLALAVTIYLHM